MKYQWIIYTTAAINHQKGLIELGPDNSSWGWVTADSSKEALESILDKSAVQRDNILSVEIRDFSSVPLQSSCVAAYFNNEEAIQIDPTKVAQLRQEGMYVLTKP